MDRGDPLGSYLLSLRLAALRLHSSGRISAETERALNGVVLRQELALRSGEATADLGELARLIRAACGTVEADLVLAEAEVIENEPAAEPERDEVVEAGGVQEETREEDAGSAAATEPAASSEERSAASPAAPAEDARAPEDHESEDLGHELFATGSVAVINLMASLLVAGGMIALSFAVEEQSILAASALAAVPWVLCGFGVLAERLLRLPASGQMLLTLALFVVPPAAAGSHLDQAIPSFLVFTALAVVTAITARLVLGANSRLEAIGVILLSAGAVFDQQIVDAFGIAGIYLLVATYALLMGLDLTLRIGLKRRGHTEPALGLLRTGGLLTYTAAFAVYSVLSTDGEPLRGEVAILAPAALLLASPGAFHGGLLFRIAPSSSVGLRLGGAIFAFGSLACSVLSFALTLLQGLPLLLWSGLMTALCIHAAYIFRIVRPHHGAALGFTIFYVTALYYFSAPPGTAYPWKGMALEDMAIRAIPLPYLLGTVGLLLQWLPSVSWLRLPRAQAAEVGAYGVSAVGMTYLMGAMAALAALVVTATAFSGFGMPGAIVAGGLAPLAMFVGHVRKEGHVVAAATVLLYLSCMCWVHANGLPAPAYALGCALLSLVLLSGAIVGSAPHLERPLLAVALCGSTAAICFAGASRELHEWHSLTAACAAAVLGLGGWRTNSPLLVRLAFLTLLAGALQLAMVLLGASPIDLLTSLPLRAALAAGAGAIIVVSSFARRTASLDAVVSRPGLQMSLLVATGLGLAGLDVEHPTCAAGSAIFGALLFLLAAVMSERRGLMRPFVAFLLIGSTQEVLLLPDWPVVTEERWHIALTCFAVFGLALRVVSWPTLEHDSWKVSGRLRGRFSVMLLGRLGALSNELASASGLALAFTMLGVGVAFMRTAALAVHEPGHVISHWIQSSIALAIVASTLGVFIPRPIGFRLPRNALVIAGLYFLFMWSGVFFDFTESRNLVTYWQVTASALSVLMAFGIGVRLPGVIPVALLTVVPGMVLGLVPPVTLLSALAVLAAGMVYLRGAASLESQTAYYLGTIATTAGILMWVYQVLPGALPWPGRWVVLAASATMIAVWWTFCASRGWVRPVRFLRAALDSGVLCSMIAAVCLIAYMISLIMGIMAVPPVPPTSIALPIRLAAVGVALSLVAYYIGGAAAFKSSFMVYVAEMAFFGAATLLRTGFPDIFKTPEFRVIIPYLILVLSFTFAGIGEFLARKGLELFSRPLSNTGIFLPLIALLALWSGMTGPHLNIMQEQSPVVIAAAGLFYMTANFLRRNRGFALFAAVLFNVATWFLYDELKLDAVNLPQLLFVPLGISIIIAGHVMRDSLSEFLAGNLRLLGLTIVYLGSAVSTFMYQEYVHQIVLVILSLVGVLVGLRLQLRRVWQMGIICLLLGLVAGVFHQLTEPAWQFGVILVAVGLALVVGVVIEGVVRHRRTDRALALSGDPATSDEGEA